MKELLPAGSVVLLKGGKKRLIIIGVMQVKQDENKLFDYLAVPYPEGYLGEDSNFLFQHEDIDSVVFTGFTDPERDTFLGVLSMLYEQAGQRSREGSDKSPAL